MKRIVFIALVLLAISACGGTSSTSKHANAVELDVSVSRDSVGRAELMATVKNNTRETIARWDNCNYWNGMTVLFASRDHLELSLSDPTKRQWCPDTLFALAAGGVLEGKSRIPDTLYTWEGVPVFMSPGTYYVHVRFEWQEAVEARRHVLVHAISFAWPVPAEPKQVDTFKTASAQGYSQTRQLEMGGSGTGVISGAIVDSLTARALAYATARIVESDLSLPIETENILLWYRARATNTQQEGRFLFSGLPVGSYDLRASMICYRRDTVRVEVRSGDTTYVQFRLPRDEQCSQR